MTNPMRPGPPHAAPRDQRWVPATVPDARTAEEIEQAAERPGDRKCQHAPGNPYKINPCNAAGVARVAGRWLCPNHLRDAGLWVDWGIVMRWELEPTEEES